MEVPQASSCTSVCDFAMVEPPVDVSTDIDADDDNRANNLVQLKFQFFAIKIFFFI